MEGNFSNRVQDVIRLSREEALRLGHDYIGTEHLLLGIIREGEGIAVKILRNLGVDLYKLKKSIEDTVRTSSVTSPMTTIVSFRRSVSMICPPRPFRGPKRSFWT